MLFYCILNLLYSACSRVPYDCSMAKKRRAEEQASGVPINKRKSLLMKPRHYRPDMGCKESPDNRNEDDGLLETNDHATAGSKRHGPSSIYFCHQTSFLGHGEDMVPITVKYLGFRNKTPTIISVNIHLLRLHLF